MNNNSTAPIDKIVKPIQDFLHKEASGGILLIIFTVVALVWANSPLADSYLSLWHTYITIDLGGFLLKYSLHHWINDGLMAIFFFVVGLEIKREIMVGELSSFQKASLPIAAAIGGMLFPALIYTFFNLGTEGSSGWGIPMATDIAFVVGILALLGSRVPLSLKIFVVALAIADDIGAVLVIAFFYTDQISLISLIIAAGFLLTLFIISKMGVKSLIVYTLLGIGLWLAFLKSGVHATIAGVLLAFTIPASSRTNTKSFYEENSEKLRKFHEEGEHGEDVLTNETRQTIVQKIEISCTNLLTPLQRFEHELHPWVAYFIIPVFALANAGVSLGGNFISGLTSSISIGIALGLLIGKLTGILSLSWLAVKYKLASLPEGVTWKMISGAALLAGIGFTMSLFIANLAFNSEELLNTAKIGILFGSLLSGLAGYIFLKSSLKK